MTQIFIVLFLVLRSHCHLILDEKIHIIKHVVLLITEKITNYLFYGSVGQEYLNYSERRRN